MNTKTEKEPTILEWNTFGMSKIETARSDVLKLADSWIVGDTQKVLAALRELTECIEDIHICIDYDALKVNK